MSGPDTPIAREALPLLSVVIPTFNRAPILAKCIQALCRQTCAPGQLEILVSDDGSSDDTAAQVARLAAESPLPIRYLHQANAGANRARNQAIATARGSILLLINDDTIAVPGMVLEHLQAHAHHPDDRVAVLGRMTVAPDLPPSRLAPLHLDLAFAGLRDGEVLDWKSFFTCNVSVKKSLLQRGGVFEERIRYHEDLELALRLSAHGLRIVYRAAALGYHDHYLGEAEFMAIAQREARALRTWARLAPDARPLLASLGYEPALPWPRRWRHRAIDIVVNRGTLPLWSWVARHCPQRLDGLSRTVYSQMYQSRRRAVLREGGHDD